MAPTPGRKRLHPISNAAMLGYALPALPLRGIMVLLEVFLSRLYAEEYGMQLASLTRMAVLSSCIDALVVPALGALSDRARYRGISRGVFAMVWVAPLAVTVTCVFSPPALSLRPDQLAAYCATAIVLLRLSMSAVEIPYLALGTEMTTEPDARSKLVATRECMGVVGSIFAVILPTALASLGFHVRQAFQWAATGLAAATAAALFVCVLTSPQAAEVSRPALPERTPAKGGRRAVLLRELVFGPEGVSVRALLCSQVLGAFGGAMNGACYTFFVAHVLVEPGQLRFDPGGPFLAGYIITSLVCMPMWMRLGRSFEKATLLAASYLLQGASFLAVFFVCSQGEDLRGDLGACCFLGLTAAVGNAGAMIFPASMRSDLCTQDEYITGKRREGQIEGMVGLMARISGTLGVVAALTLLQAGGFKEGIGGGLAAGTQQDFSARYAILVAYAAIPGIAAMSAGPCLRGYKLSRAKQAEFAAAVEERRHGV